MTIRLLRRAFTRVAALAGLATRLAAAEPPIPAKIEFNRDIRPILSDTCFHCHGPDAHSRKAGLRLDLREEALKPAESGETPIVPGNLSLSEAALRVLTSDKDELMPPPKAHKPLTPRQKELFKRWVEQGAEYQEHWSYARPVKAAIPAGANGVDVLVQRRLAEVGLTPSAEADRRILIRRLTFDLVGLPPTPQEVDAFVRDQSADAYERLVERLLSNPHYGERMAIGWLDVVRFADTIGYHSDNPHNVWPYRDWVIQSFNANKPFDRFTLEQVAGDLLPDASRETRIGSAFNRLILSTQEGGAQPKDYEQRYLTDRVRAIGAVWLGQTTGCAQCHDHKFDPFTSRDFYALGAFFADVTEPAIGLREDGMVVATPEQEQRLAELEAQIATANKNLAALDAHFRAGQQQWEGDLAAFGITLSSQLKDAKIAKAQRTAAGRVEALLKKKAADRSEAERKSIETYYRTYVTGLYPAERDAVGRAVAERSKFYAPLPKVMVSTSAKTQRTVRILPRGNWMDESGEQVRAALPHYLPQPKIEGRELTRLDLAQWLVSRDNPLTARTVMNRLWKQFFGTGLSKVVDDLGAQGETPPNPALLDWLACEFMDRGWDMKHMVRTIVTSRTYRQASTASPALAAADPANREHARQSSFRLEAELVRDNALAIAGLLVPKIGGPSVKPYQPPGYWENLNFPVRTYVADQGESQYRRGLYTWWQRSHLHPSMVAFDAPSREECAPERSRSNIPQQALALLNAPTYVEAARAFATRILRECQGEPEARIAWAWQAALQRPPRAEEARTLRELWERHLAIYRTNSTAAAELLKIGLAPVPAGQDAAELAAWTHVARVLLNLHETITRS
jgi:hypothetical protein